MEPTEEVVHPVFSWLTAARRAWLYRVTGSVSLLASAYGVLDSNKAGLFVGLAASLLGVGTATAHTPTDSTEFTSTTPGRW